jgi:hypothetical protein
MFCALCPALATLPALQGPPLVTSSSAAGTPAGIIAAVEGRKPGLSVVVVGDQARCVSRRGGVCFAPKRSEVVLSVFGQRPVHGELSW